MAKKKTSITLSKQDWADDYTSALAVETLKMFTDLEHRKGLPPNTLHGAFMSKFMAATVYNELVKKEEGVRDTQDKAYDRFSHIKAIVQTAVATAFEVALSSYARKPVEYYCTIKTVPRPTSKTAH